MKNVELRILMNNLRDFLNYSSGAKLSRRAFSDLFDNLLELDSAIENSTLTEISNEDLVETYRLLDECNTIESSMHPLICAIRNGMRDYLAPKGLLGNRAIHEDRSYELSRQNSILRNISMSIKDKPIAKTKEELSASKEESLDRAVDMMIVNAYRRWSSSK
jgi:hypothetical protein